MLKRQVRRWAFLGEGGANELLKNLYDAQRSGAKALKVQSVAKLLGEAVGGGMLASLGWKLISGND
jgi:hypothetical protein